MKNTIALLFLAAAVAAQTPTVEQSLSLKSASSPRISPDGKFVVYQVQQANWEDNSFKNEIWGVDVSTGQRSQYTNTKKSSTSPEWSPDGKRLAFLSDREAKRQIYVISTSGGEAMQLTKSVTGVTAFHWSPDGLRIAYTEPDAESQDRKDRKEKYGEYEVVKSDYTMTHLWMLNVDAPEKSLRLTSGQDYTVGGFSWSPDSQWIAFSAARDPDLGSSDTQDIYVARVTNRLVKKIVDTKGPDSNPVWSPDGKEIAFQTSNGQEFFFYANTRIAVVSSEGGTPRVLTQAFDEDPSIVAWSPDGIYFTSLQKTYSHLFRLNPATKAIDRVTGPLPRAFAGFSFTKDFAQMAFVADGAGSGPAVYSEVFVSSAKPFTPKKLTSMGDQLKDWRLATREIIEWRSQDGTPIEGVLIKPADFQAGKKYPLLVVIHGGPTGVDRAVPSGDRTYPLEMFAAKGAVILRPNYRGSAGYGEKFRSLNVRNLGVGDYWDVISGVDHLIAMGIVDRDRVGAMGW